ncbi:MAG: bifunctional phosphopantothenoylcysteine decarboxylase/phosphopantothenate--cysteine ligase CoaBC [Ignavibacteriaceae bacterium]|nr:bifunctional phosphopantothenoylcysteine decarboxylase/phosphopantothenate--cysteine ligase CoaBC [Ignavibacteriaceae bacterium]
MLPEVFSGKKILLGVTGGIAAYKACLLVRELKKSGAEVHVIMTSSAAEFVAPLTFSALSGNPVIINIFPENQKSGSSLGTWHIDLALEADLMIIAPATVNTIAKITYGIADNALTVLFSAMRSPVLICPAADMDMYNSPASTENLDTLERRGYYILPAEAGELASGLKGVGRLPETEKILEAAASVLMGYKKDLTGTKLTITAGPSYEDIDPVRFIGNRSTGLMGYSIAKAAWLRGAEVELISGPSVYTPYPELKFTKVRSALEMQKALIESSGRTEITIMAAAVADFRPAVVSDKKIKKESSAGSIALTENPDLIASIQKQGKTIVGFALETDNEEANALKKLSKKGLDMIVLNSLNDAGSGFEVPTNAVTVFTSDGGKKEIGRTSKFEVANRLLDQIMDYRKSYGKS